MEKIMLYIISIFFFIGIIDYIFGGKLKLGKELENGIKSMGSLAISMIGILSITPLVSEGLNKYIIPKLNINLIDPSIISSSLIAVDMGGYKIAEAIGRTSGEVYFSGILISSILGCTISFTLPLALGMIKEEDVEILCKGVLCGIITLPVGLFIGGLLLRMPIIIIFKNLLPIIFIALFIIIGLKKIPNKMVKIFKLLARFIFIVGLIGLGIQGVTSITGVVIIKKLLPLEESIIIVGKIAIFLAGANVMLKVIKVIFNKKIEKLKEELGVNSESVAALIGSLASAVIVFTDFDKLDYRGKIICSAFSVAGAYVFGGQLGYVVTEAKEIVFIYILVKLICGFSAIMLAMKISKNNIIKQKNCVVK